MKKADKEEYTYEKHHFYADKHAGKQVCAWCGLVALRNKASDWCVDKGCNYKLHPSYRSAMYKFTQFFK
ncbi:hypothetical protein X824_gp193 [Escherichia phage 4MG]|jgi:hypothetical protein|uniref:Hyphothetical protein n=1 Tax=Escherichia phage 4MG TaxID=1391428 RepID=V5KSM1_9CAUD|nr:hypothetical protein X824_gp193 [Escherichia phage 4MG]AGZ17630.1 hyphothetical protein [Escherichia phage 4MG]